MVRPQSTGAAALQPHQSFSMGPGSASGLANHRQPARLTLADCRGALHAIHAGSGGCAGHARLASCTLIVKPRSVPGFRAPAKCRAQTGFHTT